jgi:2-oxoisovalerate dehydrogenase E1 component subunit alpha
MQSIPPHVVRTGGGRPDNPHIDRGDSLPPHKLLALYHTMVMARVIDRRLWVLRKFSLPFRGEGQGEGQARKRAAAGSEAVQVAAAAALRPGVDWVVPSQHDLALHLALGVSPLDVMLAVLGRAADPSSGGRQAPGSFGSRRARILTTSAVVGTQVPHASGIAYASKLLGRDEVTLVSIGQQGTDTGDWHEGLNFAAVHRLPLVCLVQDDAPRRSAPPSQVATDLIVRRAHGYGMAAESIDGGEFEIGLAALTRAMDRARSKEGPTLVHARLTALTSRTPSGSFHKQDQLELMARHDPIERMRRQLHNSNVLDDDADDQIQRDCISVVEAALVAAQNAPMAEPAQALENVFSGFGIADA